MDSFEEYILYTIYPDGRHIPSNTTGAKHEIQKRAQTLNALALTIGAKTRWQALPAKAQMQG